ncbi:cysteine dioxygenase [Streptacidiphilus sp. EB129]|uniref:cysteine dioxygenase family protein n=1 Tax=Streptacidiphilus sp. EB129 TaxID=3156262 RepID=UPI003517D300
MASSGALSAIGVGTTPRIDHLVLAIREVVERGLPPQTTADRVARLLEPSLGDPRLLSAAQQEGDPASYRQHLLHAEADGSFSLVALVWLPGQQTTIHDHLCWCVSGVHRGQETERRYRLAPGGRTARLLLDRSVVNRTGALSAIAPPGDIHQVTNTGSTKAISLHVYGADVSRLGSSVRRVYRAPVDDDEQSVDRPCRESPVGSRRPGVTAP